MSLKRSDIITNLVTLLRTISVTNGYHSNVKVDSWRTAAVDEKEMKDTSGGPVAVLIVRDKGRDVAQDDVTEAGNLQQHTLHIEVDIAVNTEPQARYAIADILKAVSTDTTLSGKAIDVMDAGDEIFSDQQGDRVFSPLLRLDILYQTTRLQEE